MIEPFTEHDNEANDVDFNNEESFLDFVNVEDDNLFADDNFEDFLTRADDPHFMSNDDDVDVIVPSKDMEDLAVTIKEEEHEKALRVSGHVILNQCGSLLIRRNHDIKGSSKHIFFLQKIHATSPGSCVPLL